MKFFADGPSIPDLLLEKCDEGRVVFLCGAGVSIPSKMPTFKELTQYVINFFQPADDSEIMQAFQPWIDTPSANNMPLDQIFNLLHLEYGKNEVNVLVTERLRLADTSGDVGHAHGLIKRISSNQLGVPQIVTTNFDLLFELGETTPLQYHVPPNFPDISLGASLAGITYLHGRLASTEAEQHPYVLSSADFGRAYLSEAWATNFVRNLLERYTVVLVGYQAEDPPVKYLLQGLNHDGNFDRSRLYAFDQGKPTDIEAKWRDRGVTAIAFDGFPHLWQAMEAWAERADNPKAWKSRVVEKTQRDPKTLPPHVRGQVAHVLRSVQGAKLFADAEPLPHPEWICVLDGYVRSASKEKGRDENAEDFVPHLAYGLDDDLEEVTHKDYQRGIRNDHLLEWRPGDDNPVDFHRLGNRQSEGYESTPPRLFHLMRWVCNSLESPVMAWWAIRQNGLHPRLIKQIEWELERGSRLDAKARRIWRLILEHHRDVRNRDHDLSWYSFKPRLVQEGWTASVLRSFERLTQPRLKITPPPGIAGKPPSLKSWEEINKSEIGHFEIKFFNRHDEKLDVPNHVLGKVIAILEHQLSTASGMLFDAEVTYFPTPTCYPDRGSTGEELTTKASSLMVLFMQLYDRFAELNATQAYAHAMTWDNEDPYFFRKLKLYALARDRVFMATQVVDELLSLTQASFWESNVRRELLFLLEDRWKEFSPTEKERLAERILAGPDKVSWWSDEEYPAARNELTARYGRYLQLKGCDFPVKQSATLDEIIATIPGWNDAWAIGVITRYGAQSGWVATDEDPQTILDLSISETVDAAIAEMEREHTQLIEKHPFAGLVKTHPRRAFLALSATARKGDYPTILWSTLIEDMPQEIAPKLRLVYLHHLLKLPQNTVHELRFTLARMLEYGLAAILNVGSELGWQLYDHIVGSIMAEGVNATKSLMTEINKGDGAVLPSRRTLDHAIIGPVGMCTEALINVLAKENPGKDSLIPTHIKLRFERLFTAPGEGADHAVAICMRQLNWFVQIDPTWAKETLVPMMAFEHPNSEPAWHGFLYSGHIPSPPTALALKPLFLNLYPWIEAFAWDKDLVGKPAQWFAWLYVFSANEPYGFSQREIRNILRKMSDSSRNRVISWLGAVGNSNEDGWIQLVVPFIERVWPRERIYRTASAALTWIRLLDDAGDHFPALYSAMKRFLVPVEDDSYPFYSFTGEPGEGIPITSRYPELVLDLINTVVPLSLMRPPYELPKILNLIAEAEPGLTTDPRYLRLIDLVERS